MFRSLSLAMSVDSLHTVNPELPPWNANRSDFPGTGLGTRSATLIVIVNCQVSIWLESITAKWVANCRSLFAFNMVYFFPSSSSKSATRRGERF